MTSKEDDNLDVEKYFTPIEWSEMSDFEKVRVNNILENYQKLKSFGFRPQEPAFVKEYNKRQEENEKRATASAASSSKSAPNLKVEGKASTSTKKGYRVNEGASTSSGTGSKSTPNLKDGAKAPTSTKVVHKVNEGASTSSSAASISAPSLKKCSRKCSSGVEVPSSLSVRLDVEKYFSDEEWRRKTEVERERLRAELETYSLNRTFGKNSEAPVFVVAYKERKIRDWQRDREKTNDGSSKNAKTKKSLKPSIDNANQVNSESSKKNSKVKKSVKPVESSGETVQVNDDSSVFKIPAIPKKSKSKSNPVASTSTSTSDQTSVSNGSKAKSVKSGNRNPNKVSLRRKIKEKRAKLNKEKQKKEEEEMFRISRSHHVYDGFYDQLASMTFEETDDLCFTAEEMKLSLSIYLAEITAVQIPTAYDEEDEGEEETDDKKIKKEEKKKDKVETSSDRSQPAAASSSASNHDGEVLERSAQPQSSDNNKNGNVTEVARRYPKRNVSIKNYAEPENINMDDFIFCDECGREWLKECPAHGKMINIPDLPVNRQKAGDNYARETTPRILGVAQSKMMNAGKGVWTRDMIKKQVLFGPYKGRVGKGNPKDPNYAWQLREMEGGLNYVDASDERYSNWMRYVNCARNINEMNLMAFQFEGAIYYRTIRLVSPHEELSVFYGEQFGNALGIDVKNFRNPVETSEQDVSFYCAECNSVFTSPLYLEQHEIACLIGIVARRKQNVAALKNLAEDTSNKQIGMAAMCDQKLKKMPASGQRFECDICNAQFATKASLTRHIKGIHDKIRPFKCENCDADFVVKSNLTKHINRVHLKVRLYKCNMCNYKCSCNSHLQTHINSVHMKLLSFECTMCNYKSSRNGDLQTHIKSVHMKLLKFECTMCNYKCSQNSNLQTHIKSVHKNLRPFECTMCNYKSSHNSHLQEHMVVHTGEKAYQCTLCNKNFSFRGNLNAHIKRVHK